MFQASSQATLTREQQQLLAKVQRVPAAVRIYQAGRRELAAIPAGPRDVEEARARAAQALERMRAALLVTKNRLWALGNQAVRRGTITQIQLDALKASGLFDTTLEVVPNETMQQAADNFGGLRGLGILPLVLGGAVLVGIVGIVAVNADTLGNSVDSVLQGAGDVYARIVEVKAVYAAWTKQAEQAIQQGEPLPPLPTRSGGYAPGTQTPDQRFKPPTSTATVLGVLVLAGAAAFAWFKWAKPTKKGKP